MTKAKEVDMRLTVFSLGLHTRERERALQELGGIDEDIRRIVLELQSQLGTMNVLALSEFLASPQSRNELKVCYARERFCGAVRTAKGQCFCNELAAKLRQMSEDDDFLQEIINLLTLAAFKEAVVGLADEGEVSTEGL